MFDSAHNKYIFTGASLAVTIILILMLINSPRIIILSFIFTWLVIVLYQTIFITSNLSQDLIADRDDAVEIATDNFLNYKNPWLSKSPLGLPITTGPSSILISIPSVILTKKINSLTFIFWITFFILLLITEYSFKNESFIIAFLLFLIPSLGYQRTIYYSLDEMYYVLILFPILLFVLNKKKFFLAGFIFSIIVLSRLSYIFLSAGLYFGWVLKHKFIVKNQLKILFGFFTGILLILFPFILVSGPSIFKHNFINNSIINSEIYQSHNYLFKIIREFSMSHGSFTTDLILVSFITLLLIFLFSITLSKHKLANPFWDVAFASLLTFNIPFYPIYEGDYILSMTIPLLFLISWSSGLNNNKEIS